MMRVYTMALWGGFGGKLSLLDAAPQHSWIGLTAVRCDVYDEPTGFRTQDMVLDLGAS
jgi:hypothetical protein